MNEAWHPEPFEAPLDYDTLRIMLRHAADAIATADYNLVASNRAPGAQKWLADAADCLEAAIEAMGVTALVDEINGNTCC